MSWKTYNYYCVKCNKTFTTKSIAGKHLIEEHFFDFITQKSVNKKYKFKL